MATINQAWHDANPTLKNATLEQRQQWHIEHQKHCGCPATSEVVPAEVLHNGPLVPPKPLDSDLDCD